MVRFYISQASSASVGDYMESLRGRILLAIREQMGVEMEELAQTVGEKLHGNPVQSRTGNLLSKVLTSPKVYESPGAISGTVTAQDGAKNVGLWLEKGISVPALTPPKARVFSFFGFNDQLKYSLGHRAFKVAPHAFMIPSLQEREPAILENIRQKVADAVA